MLRYEQGDCDQEHFAEDGINVNCVVGWHSHDGARGGAEALAVDFHNGWYFDRRFLARTSRRAARVLAALKRSERGRVNHD